MINFTGVMRSDVKQSVTDAQSAWRSRRILITGGAGFIGSNLAIALVGRGAQVTVLDAMLPMYGGNEFNLAPVHEEIAFVRGDIRDESIVRQLVAGQDYIFNLAAQVSYIDAKERPFLDLDINGRGHLNVLEAVRELTPQARVIFSSSRLVYGRILTIPVREDHPTEPLSLYGVHKLLGEKYYRYYADTYGLSTVSVRIPNPYGPRQQMKHSKYSIVGWFIRQALEGKTIRIFGDGQQERDYLYVDDITDALLRLAESGQAGEVYNIGTHERVRFADMAAAVVREVGRGRMECVPWPRDYERNETGNYIADTSKVERLCRWQARISLAEGVARTAEYFRQNRKHYW
ncbi:MAG: NAD-dependent epimerase/dehydratase family protein [Candidatus Andersenbacteria bacterium]|nr:NAD-dependent epimerase/dehydratase family protein [Candidatus Andersenbacteria bacterium]